MSAPLGRAFRTSRIILFGDCDPAGAVYTPRIANFVVEAGLEFLSHVLGGPAARSLMSMGIFPPARTLSIEFLSPMTWDEEIKIEVGLTEMGERSFSLMISAFNTTDKPIFRGSLVHVCVSMHTKIPVALPFELRAELSKWER